MHRVKLIFLLLGLCALLYGCQKFVDAETNMDNALAYEIPEDFDQLIYAAIQSSRGESYEALINHMNAGNFERLAPYPEDDRYRKLSRAIGWLRVLRDDGIEEFCTASVISKDQILTNWHCLPMIREYAVNATLTMNYYVDDPPDLIRRYPVNLDAQESDRDLDYAILKVQGDLTEWGSISFDANPPGDNWPLIIIHHPGGRDKKITRGKCKSIAPAIRDNVLRHICDTIRGSSGAPILYDFNGEFRVVGLHNKGLPKNQRDYANAGEFNRGIPISEILKESKILRQLMARSSTTLVVDEAPPERVTWETTKDLGTVSGYRAFVENPDNSDHLNDARVALRNHSEAILAMQAALHEKEFDIGGVDGVVGEKTRTALIRLIESDLINFDLVNLNRIDTGPIYTVTTSIIQLDLAAEEETKVVTMPEAIRDCDNCPWMQKIHSNDFFIGSPTDEEKRPFGELEQQSFNLSQGFYISRSEITWEEWMHCVQAGWCERSDERNEQYASLVGHGLYPVSHVSWKDAWQYADWLSDNTGKNYRLPDEIEWEIAARGGTKTPYYTGDTISRYDANFAESFGATKPVKEYKANRFNVFDMLGNVAEWTASCSESAKKTIHIFASKAERGTCFFASVRGGHWASSDVELRASRRERQGVDTKDKYTGFRVLRELD